MPCFLRDGKQMSTPLTKLNSSKNDFERNSVDVFNLTLPNVGEMKRVRIGHDNWGMGADWHLKLVGGVPGTSTAHPVTVCV